MVYAAAYNPTDSPVVIDGEGRTLGGRAWGPVETTEDAVKAALSDGRLVKAARPARGADVNPDAATVFDDVDALEQARKAGDPVAEAEVAAEADATPSKRARSRARSTEES